MRRLYAGYRRQHPFDREMGIDAGGFVDPTTMNIDPALAGKINFYLASQPSIVQRSIERIPDPADSTFLDIGCGKGRPMMVASQFPFARIVGWELSADLAAVAIANFSNALGADGSARFDVVVGNAVEMRFPAGRLVVFVYHAMGCELLQQLVHNLERALESDVEHVYFVYYNPVCAEILDGSPHFERWAAEMYPYDESEIGYGVDTSDAVVTWQSTQERTTDGWPGRDRPVTVISALRAEVADH
ncbi:MAG: class I SAM-dependent methyltransferase [Acidimicrobiia bacterium]